MLVSTIQFVILGGIMTTNTTKFYAMMMFLKWEGRLSIKKKMFVHDRSKNDENLCILDRIEA